MFPIHHVLWVSACDHSFNICSVQMQGQDTLEVRSVTLPDGQSASLVLEDGKLQRIVSSAGNIVEVHWQGGWMKEEQKGGPDRHMAIKLRSAQNM